MKFLKIKLSVIFFLFLSLLISSGIKAQFIEVKDYPLLNSLNEINKKTRDTCVVSAFVNSVYNCPPCPKGADCKPCIGNHIMVADSLNAKKQFRVFVNEPGKFSIGEKYILLIRLYKYNSEEEVYEGKLIVQE
jgi:hypothetical protein